MTFCLRSSGGVGSEGDRWAEAQTSLSRSKNGTRALDFLLRTDLNGLKWANTLKKERKKVRYVDQTVQIMCTFLVEVAFSSDKQTDNSLRNDDVVSVVSVRLLCEKGVSFVSVLSLKFISTEHFLNYVLCCLISLAFC